MALALNNLKRVDMTLNKETKPIEQKGNFYSCIFRMVKKRINKIDEKSLRGKEKGKVIVWLKFELIYYNVDWFGLVSFV